MRVHDSLNLFALHCLGTPGFVVVGLGGKRRSVPGNFARRRRRCARSDACRLSTYKMRSRETDSQRVKSLGYGCMCSSMLDQH